MNTRFALIRENLKMTTRKFGERLNITGGAVTNMEKGIRGITDRTISDICREFNVNEEWLRNGTGEMFIPKFDDKLEQLSYEYNFSKLEYTFFNSYLRLDPKKREAVSDFFEDILSKSSSLFSDDIVATKENIEVVEVPKEEKSISELEMEYKKNLLKNVSEQAATVSNITKEKRKAQ